MSNNKFGFVGRYVFVDCCLLIMTPIVVMIILTSIFIYFVHSRRGWKEGEGLYY